MVRATGVEGWGGGGGEREGGGGGNSAAIYILRETSTYLTPSK